jgi:hypothetical protein
VVTAILWNEGLFQVPFPAESLWGYSLHYLNFIIPVWLIIYSFAMIGGFLILVTAEFFIAIYSVNLCIHLYAEFAGEAAIEQGGLERKASWGDGYDSAVSSDEVDPADANTPDDASEFEVQSQHNDSLELHEIEMMSDAIPGIEIEARPVASIDQPNYQKRHRPSSLQIP